MVVLQGARGYHSSSVVSMRRGGGRGVARACVLTSTMYSVVQCTMHQVAVAWPEPVWALTVYLLRAYHAPGGRGVARAALSLPARQHGVGRLGGARGWRRPLRARRWHCLPLALALALTLT